MGAPVYDPRPASTRSDAELADELATRVNLMGQSRVDPERFHAEKSDIALKLRQLARRLRGEVRAEPMTVWRSK